ncbi:helix-turn-helix domain-containing protein [Pedobacter sp. UYEF25]
MNLEIITKEDLKQLKTEMLDEIRQLIKPEDRERKQWLKSADVRKLLSISPGTLQNLRINGTLRFTKIGGMMYYKMADISRLLEGGKP